MSEIKDYGNISFELLQECWLVRGHPAGNGFGNPYDWAFVLVKDGNAAIAKGSGRYDYYDCFCCCIC